MTGPLTLKRRFFFKTFRAFGNFDQLLSFLNTLPPQKTNISPVVVSGETPGTKIQKMPLRVGHFL